MHESRMNRCARAVFQGRVYQNLAMLFCLLFGLAIIVNTELSGNPMWFWYAMLFHRGAKLYADLHLAFQPLFILELDAWMRLAGDKCLVSVVPSVIHLIALCLGIQLVLRESPWPDWQKAIVLASTFLICIHFSAYLFDDFHVVSDIFYIYSLVLLLNLAKADAAARQVGLAAALGVLSGLAVTTRINDGAALLASAGICLLVLARKRKLLVAGLFVAVAALTPVLVVLITGDSFHEYISNSILRAAASKGGSGSLLADTFLMFSNAIKVLHAGGRWILLWVAVIFAVGAIAQKYWGIRDKYAIAAQFGIAAVGFAISSPLGREQLLSGALLGELSIVSVAVIYLLSLIIIVRCLMWGSGHWKSDLDAREILVLVLLFWLASGSTSSGGSPQNFFEMMAVLFLLLPVIQPFGKQANWANTSVLPILVLLGVSGAISKMQIPYEWQSTHFSPMFESREWYQHPVFGPMYIERDQLQFVVPICEEIRQGNPKPELLSLPFPYPNYFCDIPPWHGYVQTFFDTSTRAAILGLIQELRTDPPQWIVYQRQLRILVLHELVYHHGQSLAQRDLDDLIMQKIATGQWQLVEKRHYLPGDGWLIIRTRP